RVTVAVPRDVIDVSLQPERLTGGIVDLVQFVGGRDNLFTVTLGRRFRELQAREQEGPPRLVLEFHAALLAAGEPSPSPSASAPAHPAPEGPAVRTVVIDPGHGGDDVGAKGPGGTLEKDVSLAIPAGTSGPAGSDVALILWDMAQAEHLEESSALASRIQEELAEVTGTQGRGVKQAPFRVLVGAAMPAVLVEVAFISNSEEEKL